MIISSRMIFSIALSIGLVGCRVGTNIKTAGGEEAASPTSQAIVKYQPGSKIVVEQKDGKKGDTYPLSLLEPAQVCAGVTFYNQEGELAQGTQSCNASAPQESDPNLKAENIRAGVKVGSLKGTLKPSPDDCKTDGATDCVVYGPTYAAAITSGVAVKVLTGQVVAGVSGLATPSPPNCSSDGAIGCVAVLGFPAVNKGNFAASDIRTAITVAGILGTLSGAPLACSSDGQTSCLAVSNFPAVDKINGLQANAAKIRSGVSLAGVAGTLANCSVDGGAGCVAVGPSFAAALTTGAAAKILTGQSLAGVAGSAVGKPADCTSDGGLGCVTVSNFPAVDKVINLSAAKLLKIHSTVTVAGVTGTLPDCALDGDTSCLASVGFPAANASGASAKIVTGQTLGGISGSATPAPANCGADGATNCVAVALFPAIDKALKLSVANAAKIHSSLSIAGVAGTLADCSADGGTSCLAVSGFPAANSSGAASKILTGQTLAGISGSGAGRPSDCAADGSTNCVAVTLFPAVDKAIKLSGANAAKIHSTLTIAGVAGTMPSCSVDGGSSCMAVAGFPAANTTGAAAKIAAGDVLAGVTGTAGVRPSDCASDGSTGCVATVTYPSANSTGAAAKIASGDVLAGITGTASVRPSDCSTDGGTGCVAITNFPAVDKLTKLSVANAAKIRSSLTIAGVVGTLDDCSTDGGIGCVAVGPAYAAAITAGVAAKVLTGQSVAGISGSATPAPANCSTDGGTGCVAVTNFPAVDKVTNLSAANLLKIHSSVTVAAVAGTMASCSADGGTSCMAVSGFPAANSTGAAAKILTGQTLAGISGSATPAPSNCAADGATDCVAVTLFPAVDKASKLSVANAAKIRSSLTIAGVVGTLNDCSSDGGTGCVAAGPTYVAALTTGAAAKILSGQSVAGVNGSAAAKPADCASDGDVNCVAIANFPAVNKTVNLAAGNLAKISSSVTVGGVLGTMANCSVDGTTGCLTVTGFPSANTTSAAAKIITGQTLAGISGTATPAPANCAADGGTGCVAVTNFPAVDKVTNLTPNLAKIHSSVTVGGSAGTLGDCSVDGALGCYTVSAFRAGTFAGAAAKILAGQTLVGVAGSATAAPANCSSDGQTNCVAVSTYPALQLSLLTPAVLKNGTVINGVTGAYPNATYTLPSASGTADLDAATFNAKVKSSTAFEYWDSAGGYQTGAGSANLTAANIVSGISIFGATGTAAGAAPNAWDVRVGTVINGITGQLKTSCRNRANTSLFNAGIPYSATTLDAAADTFTISGHPFTSNMTVRVGASTAPTGITINSTTYYVIVVDANTIKLSAASGPGAQVNFTAVGANVTVYQWSDATIHWWDTIDDLNNHLVYPTSLVAAWTSDTDCNYSNWQDLTADASCDTATDDCIMKDKISNLMWSEAYPISGAAPGLTMLNWQKAIQYCNNLSFGGYVGWRLATQKELMDGIIHGLRDVGYSGAGTIRGLGSNQNNSAFISDVGVSFWSVTTVSGDAAVGWYANLDGYTITDGKSVGHHVLCVR